MIGADRTDVNASAAGVETGYRENFRLVGVGQAFEYHFAYFLVEMIFVAYGYNVFQQGEFVRQPLGFHPDIDASPVGLGGDFAVAFQQVASHFQFFVAFPAVFGQVGGTFLVDTEMCLGCFRSVFQDFVFTEIEVTGCRRFVVKTDFCRGFQQLA